MLMGDISTLTIYKKIIWNLFCIRIWSLSLLLKKLEVYPGFIWLYLIAKALHFEQCVCYLNRLAKVWRGRYIETYLRFILSSSTRSLVISLQKPEYLSSFYPHNYSRVTSKSLNFFNDVVDWFHYEDICHCVKSPIFNLSRWHTLFFAWSIFVLNLLLTYNEYRI